MEGLIYSIGTVTGSIVFAVVTLSSFHFLWTVFDTCREVRKYYRKMNSNLEGEK